jgi:hypothetical protein
MSTLNIKDLAITEELNDAAMSEVRGGFCGYGCMPKLPVCHPWQEKPPVSSTTTVSVSQANSQCQENPTGNNSATFCGGIDAWNNQQAGNFVGRY